MIMDKQTHTPPPGSPFDSGEKRQGDPAGEPAYHAPAAQTSRETRVTEPVVGTDGQLVEAGYGHGV
jgi:hypothetical protein